MKSIKNILAPVVALTLLVACNPKPITEESAFLTEEQAQSEIKSHGGKLLNLNDFVEQHMTMYGTYFPVRERSYTYNTSTKKFNVDTTDYTKNNLGYFSIDAIPEDGQQYYIRGRVVSEDQGGNFYKTLVIQQMVNGEQQALRISVDASNAGGLYTIGQELLIHVNGLFIGKYANQPQLCVPSYNDNIYAQYAGSKVGWAPGRIPAARFEAAVQRIGKPDISKIHCDTIKISDIIGNTGIGAEANKTYFKYDARLVCIKDVWFTGQLENQGTLEDCDTSNPNKYVNPNNANTFAPSTAGLGFPQGRIISDGASNILVSTSEYAKFACYYLPGADENGIAGCKNFKGTVTGILGHYTDTGRNDPDQYDWSITLRDFSTPSHKAQVEDIRMVNSITKEPWVPQEYGSRNE